MDICEKVLWLIKEADTSQKSAQQHEFTMQDANPLPPLLIETDGIAVTESHGGSEDDTAWMMPSSREEAIKRIFSEDSDRPKEKRDARLPFKDRPYRREDAVKRYLGKIKKEGLDG